MMNFKEDCSFQYERNLHLRDRIVGSGNVEKLKGINIASLKQEF